MIKIKCYNKETECKVNDGVAPNTILYTGLIENIPSEIMDVKVSYVNLFNEMTKNKNCDSVLIIET